MSLLASNYVMDLVGLLSWVWSCGGSAAASLKSVSVSVVSDTGVVEALALAESTVEDKPSIGVDWQSCEVHESACEALGIALCVG